MNKRKLLNTAIGTALLTSASFAQADMILGLYAGGQIWNVEPEGSFDKNGDDFQGSFDFDSDTQGTLYVALEHPIPLIPNVKLRQTDLEVKGTGEITGTLFGEDYTGTTNVMGDLSHTDYTLYYEIFDNGLVSFDFGITVKDIDATINTSGKNTLDEDSDRNESFSGYVPMGYVAAEIGLPFTGLSVYGDVNMLAIGDHSLVDYQVGVAYALLDNIAVDLDVQLGYRSFSLKLDDLDDINTDLDFSGVYAGLEVHF